MSDGKAHTRSTAPQLPPNQQLTSRGQWPLVGERGPRRDASPWRLTIGGLLRQERSWSLQELRELPLVERTIDIHCVTRWSLLGARFRGIRLENLLQLCEPDGEARYVSFLARSEHDHSTSLTLRDAIELDTLVVLDFEGAPLAEEHGGPLRTVVPGRYFYKSLKWLERIELLAEDRLGYWEGTTGYHNVGDPWLEQRFVVRNLDASELRRRLANRDFTKADLLGVEAEGLNLDGLDASSAILRNANFTGASLRNARFDGANLSNSRFCGADLRDATFLPAADGQGADLEGVDFCGADLRGAAFRGAALLGTTFVGVDGDTPAVIDAATSFDAASLSTLDALPQQQAWLRRQGTTAD